MSSMKIKIEIAKKQANISQEKVEEIVFKLIEDEKIKSNSIIKLPSTKIPELLEIENKIHSITTNQIPNKVKRDDIIFYYYEFIEQEPETESIETHGSEQIAASTHWLLPNESEFFGLWESLTYDDNLKENLLDFAETMMMFSQLGIDHNIVSCNRLILLHGCPGTGKTSLAKALAQKLSIHMNETYQFTHLFEINSHSLFSKWFSESGKLVMKMFEQILEVVRMESNLVCILIDEVESIAFARGNISSNEPSDSVRVVNSVLTQLDRIKKYPNVLIITTSNLTASIDLAFLDRADIVMFIEQPSNDAIFKIFQSTIAELADKGMIIPDNPDDGLDDFNIASLYLFEKFFDLSKLPQFSNGNIMSQICKESIGLSGRQLRKLPFIAHALYLKKSKFRLREFLMALRSAVDHQQRSKQNIGQFNQIQNVQ